MQRIIGEYTISDDTSLLQLDRICGFLARSYWAEKRPRERIERSLAHSLCYGVYHQGLQVGFARAVTDYAVMYWLCDVFIDEAHRGRGLGKLLVESIIADPRLRDLTGILGTKDAHALYARYGFVRDEAGSFMRRQPPG